MTPTFSIGDALSAPFVLLRRRPLYLFAWGLLMAALVAAVYSLMLPAFASVLAAGGREEQFDAYMVESLRLQVAINGLNLLMYAVMLMIWTAAVRATLSPGRGDRFLFLRIGMDEVRVAVSIVAVFVGLYIALIVLVLLGVGVVAALWTTSKEAAVGVGIVYGLLVLAASIWGWIRVSLIPVASLILKRFAFAEGWAIAHGQMWKLVGLNLAIWAIYMISGLLMYAVIGGILAGGFFGQGLVWPSDIQGYQDIEPLLRPMLVPALLTTIPFALGFGWIMTLYAAPSARAARQLLDGAPTVRDAPVVDALNP